MIGANIEQLLHKIVPERIHHKFNNTPNDSLKHNTHIFEASLINLPLQETTTVLILRQVVNVTLRVRDRIIIQRHGQ